MGNRKSRQYLRHFYVNLELFYSKNNLRNTSVLMVESNTSYHYTDRYIVHLYKTRLCQVLTYTDLPSPHKSPVELTFRSLT